MRDLTRFFILVWIWSSCHPHNAALLQADNVSLSPPNVVVQEPFFELYTTMVVRPAEGDAVVYYTADGSHPTVDSAVAKFQMTVAESGVYRFRSIGSGFVDSDITELEVVGCGPKIKSMMTVSRSSDKYPGSSGGLSDRRKASVDFRDRGWTGFEEGRARVSLDFYGGKEVTTVVVSALRDHGAWIFAPEYIKVDIEGLDGVIRPIMFRDSMVNQVGNQNKLIYITIEFPPVIPSNIIIDIVGPDALPYWHAGSGRLPWLFLDEIVVF